MRKALPHSGLQSTYPFCVPIGEIVCQVSDYAHHRKYTQLRYCRSDYIGLVVKNVQNRKGPCDKRKHQECCQQSGSGSVFPILSPPLHLLLQRIQDRPDVPLVRDDRVTVKLRAFAEIGLKKADQVLF